MNDSKNFFKTIRNSNGNFSWNKKIITFKGGNKIDINGREFNLTPEIQKAMTSTNYNFKNMNDDDVI